MSVDISERVVRVWEADLTKLLLICLALGAVAGWVASEVAPSLSWGDAPTWVIAVVAALALYFAVKASRATGRILRLQLEREERRQAAEAAQDQVAQRAFQADLVAAWHASNHLTATLKNGSVLPVYDVVVELVAADGEVRDRTGMAVLPPGERFLAWPTAVSAPDPSAWGDGRRDADGALGVAVTFRDSAGRRWRRDVAGVLTVAGDVAGDVAPPDGQSSDPPAEPWPNRAPS